MKKFLRLSQKPPPPDSITPSPATTAVSVGLHPSFSVSIPPIPHPTPHYRISVLSTKDALLLRPLIPGASPPHSYVRIPWGSDFQIEEISEASDESWDEAAIVLGILGCLNLTSGAYILVITAKTDIGNFLDSRNAVYGVKSVSAIPLQESRARTILNTIAVKHNQANVLVRPPVRTADTSDIGEEFVEQDQGINRPEKATKVKFSDSDDVKVVSPLPDQEFRPSSPTSSINSSPSSGASTPSSDADQSTPIAKALASRLSFWTRLSKRQSMHSADNSEEQLLHGSDQDLLEDTTRDPVKILQEILDSTSSAPMTAEERQSELDEKVLKQCIREFTKGCMLFAYNFDITTSLQHKQHELARLRRKTSPQAKETSASSTESTEADHYDVLAEPYSTLPLWRRATKQFWWNEHMLQPFIDAGLHSYVLPVMQGFYQIASFHIAREPESSETGESALINYIIISRRSRDRAGLRYQRRGVDDDANVANFVETESVVSLEREGKNNVFSYIQIRGSIPLFWIQSGYNLKPPPVLSTDRTHEQNLVALRRHFSKSITRYGPHTVVNLAEQHGKEAVVTNAYREYTRELGSKDVRYTEYDFHHETKGMHYEKISSLISKLRKTFDTQGFTWFSGGILMSEQKAVFRVNCIDCLDRTNVVQSAFARHLLDKQLGAVALINTGVAGQSEIDIVFNDVWANNGDAISRAYAGTSALKGDYTRTGRRDITGMLNDGMNSLARMYTSTFSDWFSQAVIDFLLGNRTLSVFSEFLEKMQSTDPRERIRTELIRTEAIADSVSRVLSEGERLLSGWTLLSPAEINTRFSDKLEEKVLLLSVRALYVVSYDYALEKVARYSRIPLDQITSITKGTYILSPLEEGSRDPLQNYGFMVNYLTSGESVRFTRYSLRNDVELVADNQQSSSTFSKRSSKRGSTALSRIMSNTAAERGDVTSFVAFKALPVDPARSRRVTGSFVEQANDLVWAKTCKQAVDVMVDMIFQAVTTTKSGAEGKEACLIFSEPIVSLEEAQRSTTVMAKMEYSIKRLLWLGS
ncbi:uncharacterized protein FOMMEDRAFT_139037 [Fomitiporia mediterranea MF3/22]|uniref:uncharacterized protein n=1 Tax=Fomitiporia mediterranea (strain MF3/22) TaxID=694068 RepID=UPI00044092C7|nr:uncharacterized protein FOMMEDRAFT_139037 [Fomitiporia mediterranea MF3/22]EJD05667.1 hypothetical protein FOMMEDRAFT_139037 [Fomitiporia mediterranea MF3/22]